MNAAASFERLLFRGFGGAARILRFDRGGGQSVPRPDAEVHKARYFAWQHAFCEPACGDILGRHFQTEFRCLDLVAPPSLPHKKPFSPRAAWTGMTRSWPGSTPSS